MVQEEVEDPQSDAAKPVAGRAYSPQRGTETSMLRNILMLLMMEIRGFDRPSQFK
jgi:hypothetical protein